MQDVAFSIATIEAGILKARGPLGAKDLDEILVKEVARLDGYRVNILGPALFRWWINRFFAQLNSGNGEIVEFSFNPDETIEDYWKFPSRELLTKYAEMAQPLNDWLKDVQHRRIDGFGFYVRPEDAKPGYINTFSGLLVQPMDPSASLDEPELARVRMLLDRIKWHMHVILSNSDDLAYNFLRKFFASVIQGRGKTRIFLQFFSIDFQCGKGAFTIDFLKMILGKYHHLPTAQLDEPNGLLGRFNWQYREKLLVVMDEMGNMMFNKKATCNMRKWLCAHETDFKKEGSSLVTMNDYANLVANTNVQLAMNVEANSDVRNVVIYVDERYSGTAAKDGWDVEGEPMPFERRKQYFDDLYEAFNDPLVQSAFVHGMVTEDCATFDFQANIPQNELRDCLMEVSDDKGWIQEFLAAWAAGKVSYDKRDGEEENGDVDGAASGKVVLARDTEIEAPLLYVAVRDWAYRNRVESALSGVRNSRQLGTVLVGVERRGLIAKRRSNSKTSCRLPPLPAA